LTGSIPPLPQAPSSTLRVGRVGELLGDRVDQRGGSPAWPKRAGVWEDGWMSRRAFSVLERPDLDRRAGALTASEFPEYNRHGDVIGRYWSGLWEEYADLQFVLYDEEDDEVLGEGHAIPCRWDGTVEGLPNGIDGVLADGFALHAAGVQPNALSALSIVIVPGRQGGGLSRLMIETMRSMARERGFENLLAPVRPTWKARYPLVPIDRYAAWTRPDGLAFDPWVRLHQHLGGEILRPEPHSLRISGRVEEWEAWTGLAYPESADYVFPDGLATVHIDLETGQGTYWEPNIWLRHHV
jgi:GNAT superfamily N-acetyltransferase